MVSRTSTPIAIWISSSIAAGSLDPGAGLRQLTRTLSLITLQAVWLCFVIPLLLNQRVRQVKETLTILRNLS